MSDAGEKRRRLGAKAALAIAAPVAFLATLELLLALGGVAPAVEREDPFVGFAGNIPLFVPETADGEEWLATSSGKLELFNPQRFPRRKAPGTFRIFCLGGSTAYGRPYRDDTSFAGWLRLILPALDPARRWEVINAGGISYASYRVAELMEELASYEPDLFIVYTGHNEFLEERTYSSIKELPRPVRGLSALLAKTRVATFMGAVMAEVGLLERQDTNNRFLLPEAVAAKLDRAAGLDLYARDDRLREQVLEHYRSSLERIVSLSRSAGSELVFVTPASNLRSCSPFKSEHTDGLAPEQSARSRQLLEVGRRQNQEGNWTQALATLDQGLALDPRFAELHFERGRALFSLGRHAKAKQALRRARDEDVCPLRALSELEAALVTVAAETGTRLVDFNGLLERDLESREGHTILGEEDFLDHVHPTIDGHRRLALALTEALREMRLVPAEAVLSDARLAQIEGRVEEGVDHERHAEALASLAWTLDWAGQREESRRLALEALESGVESPRVLLIAGKHAALDGDGERALDLYRRAVRADPLSPTPHYQLGLLAIELGRLEAAAARFFLATVLWPPDAKAHEKLGLVMAERGRYGLAVASLTEAKRRDPGRPSIDDLIARIERHAGVAFGSAGEPHLEIERYPSGAVRTARGVWPDPSGGSASLGVHTEWGEDGALLRFADMVNGSVLGAEIGWDRSRKVVPLAERAP